MTDSENWKERRNQVARFRVMEQETTDPLAARLLHDIVLDLEAELRAHHKASFLMLRERRYWRSASNGKSLGLLERVKTAPTCVPRWYLRLTP